MADADRRWLIDQIKDLKRNQNSQNQDYYTGYISALSTVEGLLAMLPEGDKNGAANKDTIL